MSEARSLNAVLQTPWKLNCGLKPYCTGPHDCRCLGQKANAINGTNDITNGIKGTKGIKG
jgi:hypothetical protein